MKRKTQEMKIALSDPFDAVPIIPDEVEMRDDSRGNLQLRVKSELGRTRARMAQWLGQDHSSVVELDEHGTFYIRQIDGIRTLREIVDAMVETSARSRKEVEDGVVLFTKKLMVKNMLVLQVPAVSEGTS